MQYKSERNDHFVKRLENLRYGMRINSRELAQELGISRTMMHYIKTGQKPPSLKLVRRVTELERKLKRAGEAGKEGAPGHLSLPSATLGTQEWHRLEWLESIKRRWKKNPKDRDHVSTALRVLLPEKADEIIKWLNEP